MSEEGEPAPAPVEEAPVEEEKPVEEPVQEEEKPAEEEKKPAPACSGECPCEMICKPFEESEFFGEMKAIFLWDDLIKSLAVFCALNVFFVLLLCYDFTVLGLICWVAFFATLAGLGVDIMRVIAYFKGEEAQSNLAGKEVELPAKYIDGFFDLVKSLLKAFLNVCLNAIFVKNVVFSLSMLAGFLVLIYLAGHWGIAGMLYAAILFCFIWFRLYRDHKDAVDNLFAKIKEQVQKLIEQVKEKINKPKSA